MNWSISSDPQCSTECSASIRALVPLARSVLSRTGRREAGVIAAACAQQGILSYVAWVRRTYHNGGDGPLFPMLKMYRGRWNDNASAVSMQFLRSLGIGKREDGTFDRRKANHSWRHAVRTRWREVDPVTGEHYIPNEGVADKMCGHANGSVGREYGFFPIPTLKASIYNVPPWAL